MGAVGDSDSQIAASGYQAILRERRGILDGVRRPGNRGEVGKAGQIRADRHWATTTGTSYCCHDAWQATQAALTSTARRNPAGQKRRVAEFPRLRLPRRPSPPATGRGRAHSITRMWPARAPAAASWCRPRPDADRGRRRWCRCGADADDARDGRGQTILPRHLRHRAAFRYGAGVSRSRPRPRSARPGARRRTPPHHPATYA
jgi:hypothetical protein